MKRKNKTSKEYTAWLNARARCNNKNCTYYYCYGGRGIKMIFKNFEEFFAHLGFCPEGFTLDRINNDGNYEPGNVRWASKFTQAINKSDSRYIEFGQKRQTLKEWSIETGLSVSCIFARINSYGWSIENALTKPVKSHSEAGKLGAKARWKELHYRAP